jgi:hypothetical protein
MGRQPVDSSALSLEERRRLLKESKERKKEDKRARDAARQQEYRKRKAGGPPGEWCMALPVWHGINGTAAWRCCMAHWCNVMQSMQSERRA